MLERRRARRRSSKGDGTKGFELNNLFMASRVNITHLFTILSTARASILRFGQNLAGTLGDSVVITLRVMFRRTRIFRTVSLAEEGEFLPRYGARPFACGETSRRA